MRIVRPMLTGLGDRAGTRRDEPRDRSSWLGAVGRAAGWGIVAVAAFVLIAHGCHGPDEDHEPAAVPFHVGPRE